MLGQTADATGNLAPFSGNVSKFNLWSSFIGDISSINGCHGSKYGDTIAWSDWKGNFNLHGLEPFLADVCSGR